MHPDLERLFNIVRAAGTLSEKHKEIILRKAEKLGEDVDEVEMILDSITHQSTSIKKESTVSTKKESPIPPHYTNVPEKSNKKLIITIIGLLAAIVLIFAARTIYVNAVVDHAYKEYDKAYEKAKQDYDREYDRAKRDVDRMMRRYSE